jgi:hypothetical protein
VRSESDEVIEAEAQRFRQAIVAALPLDDVVLDHFPHGTCGDVAILLGEFFYRTWLGEWTYRSGIRDDHTHAWLERDGVTVDITADQFPDVDQAVIVTRASTWHDTFTPAAGDQHPALISSYDLRTQQRLRLLFSRIGP